MKKEIVKLEYPNRYVERREKFISDFKSNVQIEYRNSPHYKEYLDRAIDLTVALQVAPCDEISKEFVADLLGFMAYCSMDNIPRSKALTTIFHDLNEFEANRNKSWFCPRSFKYSKYLSGASGVESI